MALRQHRPAEAILYCQHTARRWPDTFRLEESWFGLMRLSHIAKADHAIARAPAINPRFGQTLA
jgi:hypothetical protein